ncbi:MAG TPA: hypothetical protein VLE02_01350 [Nitrosarchaeum sp.]|nr:hypothetical protein [Nitrosarchaeum sp.]
MNSFILTNVAEYLNSGDVFNMRLVAREFTIYYNYLEACSFAERNVHLILHGGSFIAEQLKTFGACLKLKLTGKTFLPVLKSMKKFKVLKYVGELTVKDSDRLLNEDLEIMKLMTELRYVKFTESEDSFDIKRDIKRQKKLNYTPYWRKLDVLGSLKKLNHVKINGILLQDVSMLGHVRSLDLTSTFVTDVSALGNVEYLDLTATKVADVSALGNLKTLILSVTKVVDVSALGKVIRLDLSHTDVEDVSALSQVRYLNLAGCLKLKDVSMLTGVKALDLSYCSSVSSAEGLSECEAIDLTSTEVKDVSMLGKQKALCLKRTCVKNVTSLKNVRDLNLAGSRVTDVSSLTGVVSLNIKGCNITDPKQLTQLKNVKDLYICTEIFKANRNGVDLREMTNLEIVRLPNDKPRKISLNKGVQLVCK